MNMDNGLLVNEQGHLTTGGVDTIALAETYQTPLYVMNEAVFRDNCRAFARSLQVHYQNHGLICYASKAFCCKEVYRILQQEGLGADVVSIGEIYTAVQAGFPAENLCFHGNNKAKEELDYALEQGVGRFVVDNLEELALLQELAERNNQQANILLRIKPGVDAHTHQFIKTGQIDSKFGFAYETGEALQAAKLAVTLSQLQLVGVHCHIGSQIFDTSPFILAAQTMMDLIHQVKQETSVQLHELNLGGGFGIAYTFKDCPIPLQDYMQPIVDAVKKKAKELQMELPFLLFEPGRAIAAPAGITLYTVGSRKEIPNTRTYLCVDGGMTDNPRYALYQAEYQAVVANRAGESKSDTVTLAGKCCESGDIIGANLPLQQAQAGDVVAVLSTGAYNYTMASNYNRIGRPAVVMVKDGKPRIIVNRETLEDLVAKDV